MCLVKTLLDKTSGKKSSEGERVHISNNTHYGCLIKNLTRKTQWTKPCEEKRVHHVLTPPNDNINSETRIFVFQACAPSS